MVDEHIHRLITEKNKPPHLGLIQTIVKTHIDNCFNTFFQLSKKIKAEVIYIITWQYRFTPLRKEAKINYRAPNSHLFVYALKFLNLRTRIHPDINSVWQAWKAVYDDAKQDPEYFKEKKIIRRRRRRR